MFVISLISSAFALDCTGRNADTCEAVNELATLVNAEMGSTVIADAGVNARFRTSTIYNQLERVRVEANSQGCRTDGSFDGWTGGQYDLDTTFWSGAWGDFGGAGGDTEGLVIGSEFVGDWFIGNTDSGDIGESFSGHNAYNQIAADRDVTGFMVGSWIRIVGRHGIFVALHGECDDGVNVADAFETLYRGDLPEPVIVPPRVFVNEVFMDPGTTNAFWFTGTASAGDTDCDGATSTTDDEFVEIMNAGPGAANLSGWTLREAGVFATPRFTFPPGTTLPAGRTITVFNQNAELGATDCNYSAGALTFNSDLALNLNNSSETVSLLDATATLVDSLSYGTVTGDTSVNRFGDPDATAQSTFTVQGVSGTPTHADEIICEDADGDDFSVCELDCDDDNAGINPDETDIPGNGIDEDCDGSDAELCFDLDEDNFTDCDGDCDDNDAGINPDAIDVPDNGIDEDCDGSDATIIVPSGTGAIFSQYVEGSSNNKAVEITNLDALSLATNTCSVRVYSNGSPTPTSITLTAATLATRDSFVLCNTAAAGGLSPSCDQLSGSLGHNGDDALELVCGGVTQDIIGQTGFDPGSAWGTSPDNTIDRTLFRDCATAIGDRLGTDAFTPTGSGWTGTTIDDFSGLGAFPVCAP